LGFKRFIFIHNLVFVLQFDAIFTNMEEKVILVDIDDNVIGEMDKMEAHELGKLHRAFSVFILNSKGELLLQQRAFSKYHSPGLWTNTCCSHQRRDEDSLSAAHRRLNEEMGISSDLTEAFTFLYKADMGNGLTEHELDHVIVGVCDQEPLVNDQEVADWAWVNLDDLKRDLADSPEKYTAWFKIVFDQFYEHIQASA
jgi:isopentenyl-diphosphate Delta-isomerase